MIARDEQIQKQKGMIPRDRHVDAPHTVADPHQDIFDGRIIMGVFADYFMEVSDERRIIGGYATQSLAYQEVEAKIGLLVLPPVTDCPLLEDGYRLYDICLC